MQRSHRKPPSISTPFTTSSFHSAQNSMRYIGTDHDSDDRTPPVGSANTLTRAMTVTKFHDMLDCIEDLKIYSGTVEKDLPAYLNGLYSNGTNFKYKNIIDTNDLIQIAKQRWQDNRYVLLNDLIQQQQEKSKQEIELSVRTKKRSELHEKQVEYMKRVIAAQPSALEAIYLEALLDPDRWERDQRLLQSSSNENLTANQQKRLAEILNKFE